MIHARATLCQPRRLLACGVLLSMACLAGAQETSWELPPFALTERSGRTVTREDLLGRPWIADFIFTRCAGPCPVLTARMAGLQRELPPEVRLVTFTLDPDFDTPQVLDAYARRAGADPDRWLFLTGPEVRKVVVEGFKQAVVDDPRVTIVHSVMFVLVDADGKIHLHDWGDGRTEGEVQRLIARARSMVRLSRLPAINASLNGTCAALLVIGLLFIKRKRVAAHKACMVSAFFVSIAFLGCYLYYHAQHGITRFAHEGWPKALYLSILGTHTLLAALVPFLAIVTLRRGFRMDVERHRRIARWTFPIWLYVSVTGVAVYWMLYHWHPTP